MQTDRLGKRTAFAINSNSLMYAASTAYIFSIVFLDGTIVFKAATLILYLFGLLYYATHCRLTNTRVSPYVLLMLLFIAYNALSVFLGNALNPDVSLNRLETQVLNFASNFLIMWFCINKENGSKLANAYCNIAMLFFFFVLVYSGRNIIASRFGAIPLPFGLSGTNGAKYNSNTISRSLYIGIFMGHYHLLCIKQKYLDCVLSNVVYKKAHKAFVAKALLLSVGVLLSGSRSAVLVVLLYVCLYSILSSKNVLKRAKYAVLIALSITITYILIMRIPALYDIVGSRFEVFLSGIFSDEIQSRTSFFYRDAMIEEGIKMFSQRPLFGYGLDYFSIATRYGGYSHNNFVEVLVSCGICGFVLYYSAVASLVTGALKLRQTTFDRRKLFAIVSFILATVIMNVSHVDYVDRNALLSMYMVAGFVCLTSDIRRE